MKTVQPILIARVALGAAIVGGVALAASSIHGAPSRAGASAAQTHDVHDADTTTQIWVSPSGGLPGTRLTIHGAGFGAGYAVVFWNGHEIALVRTPGGSFSLARGLSPAALPGPRTVAAINPATRRSATTTFQVAGASPAAIATPLPTSTSPATTTAPLASQPTVTSSTTTTTAMSAQATATSSSMPVDTPAGQAGPTLTPTANQSASVGAGPAPAPASVATLALVPSAAAPGSALIIAGKGFHAQETVDLYWNSALVAQLPVAADGTVSYATKLSSTAAAGTRAVVARGSSGDQASATFTVLGGPSAAAATPSPAASSTPAATSPATSSMAPAANPTASPTSPATSPAASSTLAAPAASMPSSGATSNGCQITADSSQAEAQLLTVLNQERAAAGISALTSNAALSNVARTHSCDMLQHAQLNHNGSDGSSPFQRMAAGGFAVPPYAEEGENIGMAGGMTPSSAVTTVNNQMMAEPLSNGTHHWNIVHAAYKIVGVGIVTANGQTYVTEDFAG